MILIFLIYYFFYITWGQHNIVLVVTTSTVLILICYVLIIILAAYLVSFLNLLNRVQSCNENHLLLGANCEEDHPLMKAYTQHLTKEMEEVENKVLTTEKGYQVKICHQINSFRHEVGLLFLRRVEQCDNLFFPICKCLTKQQAHHVWLYRRFRCNLAAMEL